MTTDLANYTYGDLVAALRKDLLLDATTDILPGTILAALLDQNGKAAFPQLVVSAKVKLAFGQTTLTWSASALSAVAAVTHGLGATPAVVVATIGVTTTFLAYVGADTYTSTTFKLQGQAGSAVSVSAPASWIAIG